MNFKFTFESVKPVSLKCCIILPGVAIMISGFSKIKKNKINLQARLSNYPSNP